MIDWCLKKIATFKLTQGTHNREPTSWMFMARMLGKKSNNIRAQMVVI